MDGHRFDEFTRRLGAGLSRRQMLRILLGGAGALTGASVLRGDVAAVGIGEDCVTDENCDGDLTCGPSGKCSCDVSGQLPACPDGSAHTSGKAQGECCNGHGNCCSNNCVDNVCAADLCIGVTCGACEVCERGVCESACGSEEICCDNECVEAECCTVVDCTDINDCFRPACYFGQCVYSAADDLCEGECETCNRGGFCVGCGSEEICCDNECHEGDCCTVDDCGPDSCVDLTCVDHTCGAVPHCSAEETCCPSETGDFCVPAGGCCEDADCPGEPCLVVSCYQGQCTALPLCDADERCCETTEIAYCIPDDGCCSVDDCVVAGAGDFSCLEIDCIENICTWVPNDHHCPLHTCCCEDGSCSDKCCDQSSECEDDHDCPKGECCCKDGHCSPRCCPEHLCKVDKDCRQGECCCKDGTCSHKCCPDDDTPDDDVPVQELPDTGTGPGGDMTSWIAGAALLGGAAALLGAKLRDEDEPVAETES